MERKELLKCLRMTGIVFFSFYSFTSCVYHDAEDISNVCSNSDLTLSVSATTAASDCFAADGSVVVSASGGIEGYSFSINEEAYQSESSFSNLAAGGYTISVKDGNGCVVTQIVSVDNAQSTLEVSLTTIENSGCPTSNGVITISAIGGTEPYQYKLNSGAYQASNTFTELAAGDYSVTVTDASNCPTSTSVVITRTGPGFASDIKPIITTKCAISGCHNGGQSPNLSAYSGVKSNTARILSEISGKSMPPSNSPAGSLTQQQINQINCWVNDGALDN
jgi:hypothetical protein